MKDSVDLESEYNFNVKQEETENEFSNGSVGEKKVVLRKEPNTNDSINLENDLFNTTESSFEGYDTCEQLPEDFFDNEDEENVNLRVNLTNQALSYNNLQDLVNKKEDQLQLLRSELNNWVKLSEERSLEIIRNLSSQPTSELATFKNTTGSERLRIDVNLLINDHKYLKHQLSDSRKKNEALRKEVEKVRINSLKQVNQVSFQISDLRAKNKEIHGRLKKSQKTYKTKENELNEDILFLSDEVIKFKKSSEKRDETINKLREEKKDLLKQLKALKEVNSSKNVMKEEVLEIEREEIINLRKEKNNLESLLVKAKEEFSTYLETKTKEQEEHIQTIVSDYDAQVSRKSDEIKNFRNEANKGSLALLDLASATSDLTQPLSADKTQYEMIELVKLNFRNIVQEKKQIKQKLTQLKQQYLKYMNECEQKINEINNQHQTKFETLQHTNRDSLEQLQIEIDLFKSKLQQVSNRRKEPCVNCRILNEKFIDLKRSLRLNLTQFGNIEGRSSLVAVDGDLEVNHLQSLDSQVISSIKALKEDFKTVLEELDELRCERDKEDSLSQSTSKTEQKYANTKKVLAALCDYLQKHNEGLSSEDITKVLRKIQKVTKTHRV